MQADDATEMLRGQVPLLAHAGLRVLEVAPDRVRALLPLAANGNHHGSAFGGSLSLLGIVTGWLLAYAGQTAEPRTRNIVIADSHSRYQRPLHADLIAEASWQAETAAAYRDALARGERASVDVAITIAGDDGVAMRQDNRFVAVPA